MSVSQPTERRLNEDFDKQVDLHESEWRHEKKREPFFGPGAYWFFNVTLPTIVFAILFAYGLDFIFGELLGSPFQR